MPGSADNRIAADAHVRLRYFCSPHHQDSLLFPIIGQLEHAAGFARDDTAARKAEKLAELLDAREHADDDLALFADLLSLPEAAQGVAQLSPQQKKEKDLRRAAPPAGELLARSPFN
jgi:predicted ATPase